MRRVFTHLTSGWQTGPFIHGEKRFSGRPGLSHFGREATKQNNKSFWPTQPGGRAVSLFSLFFYVFILLIELFILLIKFNSSLTFVKDARERGAHEDCQSPLPGQVGPGLTVQQGYALARTRTSLTEAPRSPNMLVPSS